ncbi:kin of IRRE-like protein 1 [Ptychodera flava]|uniref:kin of IRRE-like protein 1 n=1 Tax=Ptychodera flava TaxID=63121 RepID=UPI00396A4572
MSVVRPTGLVTSVTITGYSKGQTKTVTAGDPETFECVALSGNPPADLIWTIGNNDITNSSEIRDISETGTDTRLCSCNPGHSCRSWEGNTVVVECLATANPDDITYIWESGDQTGDTGNSNKWTLIDEDGDDEVTVTCNASNNEGETSLTEVVKKPSAVVGTSGCDTGCIIGISVGCSVVVLLVVILVLWWWLRRRNDDKEGSCWRKHDYTKAASSNHRPNTRDAPADVEMTTASGMTTAAPPSDDVDSSKYSDRGYDDRYDDRYANNPRHRYDEPPEDYRYNEPPIDEGDGYPNYSNPSSPNYDSYDRRQQSPQLHYADLDLNPQGQNYQPPPREHTEYTTITPTIV